MSEPINSRFPFPGMEDSGELDISAIFGGGGTASDINPFDAPAAQTERPAEPTEQAKPEAPAAPAPQPVPAPNPQPVPRAQTQNPAPAAEPVNPISVAIDKQETQVAQAAAKSLFEKAPIFSYGSAKDEITDGAMTFEELRIAKSDDFPELGEGKRVSWSVEYGKVTKTISDPKGATIQSVKEEIERSKAFLDGLKKAKDKSPDCLVKPRVTAQSKGIAAYKGVFTSLEEARTSDKAICLFPSGDGRVYELRKTELGELIAPKDNVIEFPSVRAGFTPALPLIPVSLLSQIISFFRCYMNNAAEFEALVHILWDKEQEKFVVHVPPQEVSKARVNADLSRDELDETRYLHYMYWAIWISFSRRSRCGCPAAALTASWTPPWFSRAWARCSPGSGGITSRLGSPGRRPSSGCGKCWSRMSFGEAGHEIFQDQARKNRPTGCRRHRGPYRPPPVPAAVLTEPPGALHHLRWRRGRAEEPGASELHPRRSGGEQGSGIGGTILHRVRHGDGVRPRLCRG